MWDWKKSELIARANGMVARPLGVHQLAVAPSPIAVAPDGRRTMLFVLVGVSNAPKFGKLAPVQAPGPPRWELTFALGKLGLKPGQPPPSYMSAVAFGGDAFPAPSGAAHGLTFIGGSGGRIYVFDAPSNDLALRAIEAHTGPVTSLTFTGGALASGGADGFVYLWGPPRGSGGARGSGGTPRAPVQATTAGLLEKVHSHRRPRPWMPTRRPDPGFQAAELEPLTSAAEPHA